MTTRNLFSLKRTIFSLLFSFILLFSAVPIGAQAEEPARLHLVATVFPAISSPSIVNVIRNGVLPSVSFT